MKTCAHCGLSKYYTEYHRNRTRKDGLSQYCQMCARVIDRKRYKPPTPEKKVLYAQRTAARIKRNKQFLCEYLSAHPCVDCGETDLMVLEFDHVRGEKKYTISELVIRGHEMPTILREIPKCDVRCRNCHTRVTFAREGWNKCGNPLGEGECA